MQYPKKQRLWLLFFPAYLLRYLLLEQQKGAFHPVECALDHLIPFHEAFVIPYVLWYAVMIGMQLYTWFCCRDVFLRYMKFLLIAVGCTTAIYLLWPTCQDLRPTAFPRDNLLTDLVKLIYAVDTSTNVCPSEHVIGTVAAWLAGLRCPALQTKGRKAALGVVCVLIILSTMFLKQHSVLDTAAALPVCLIAFLFTFRR